MKKRYLLGILTFLLISCEFSPDGENFVKVDKDVPPPEIINRTLDLEEDTLFVWKYTRFNLDLASSDQEILGLEIKYAGQELLFQSNQGSFEINPGTLPDGNYPVVANVYTRSGTGSLADKTGYEGFLFSKEWVLIVETPHVPEMAISAKIENGFLKFSWPVMDKPYFISYELHLTNTSNYHAYSSRTEDPSQSSFIDSSFVGGDIYAQLHTYYENEFGNQTMNMTSFSYHYPLGPLYFEEDFDSLTISWNRIPFQHTTYYRFQYGEAIPIEADTSYKVKGLGLGSPRRYGIGFMPVKGRGDYDIFFTQEHHSMGISHGIEHENIVFNPSLNAYFLKDQRYIHKLDEAFKQTGSYENSYDSYSATALDFSGDNQRVVSVIHQRLVQLGTTSLNELNAKSIPLEENNVRVRMVKNLNDEVCLVGYDSYFVLFNTNTGSLVDQSEMLKGYGVKSFYNFLTSEDGRYAAFCSTGGLMIFEIIDYRELVLRYEDSEFYYNGLFDPHNPGHLILNAKENVLLFNCASMSVERELTGLTALHANPVNFDPMTHYLLLASFNQKKIFVYDYDQDELKLELPHHETTFEFRLMNNYIITDSGYHFDITSYVD